MLLSNSPFQHPKAFASVCYILKITFHDHITRLRSKANQKLSALPHVTLPERCLLMSSYITSQFSHYPLVWMIQSRRLNKKMKSTKEL